MKVLTRIILLLIFACAVGYPLSAQERCTLTLSASPEIRGLKLGMKSEEVGAILPDSIGLKYAPKADETGLVDSISLGLLD